MIKDKHLKYDPYKSITIPIPCFDRGEKILEDILLSNLELLPRKLDKSIILYGAGSLGKMAKEFFKYLDIPFLYVVDKNAIQRKSDENWVDINIIHPDDVRDDDKKNCLLIVCIVTTPLIDLRDELRDDGWEDIAFFYDVSEGYRDQYPLSNGWFLGKTDDDELESIKEVYSLLNDDISRAYYLQFLAWRRLRIELLFENLTTNIDNRFFIHEITDVLHENEVFIDCGAHTGSVTKKFLNLVHNKYVTIYAIEPDKENFEILTRELNNIPKLNPIRCALSDKDGEKKFYQGYDYTSKLSTLGKDIVITNTLDSFNIKATFIKMHLEGGEFNAINGALDTIKKYRPILTVTLYHTSDGVWKIPLLIMTSLNDYSYIMRLHSWGGTGAVLYAIPKERY